MRSIGCILLVALFLVAFPSSLGYKTKFYPDLEITSFDGTILLADASVPQPEREGEHFPVLIFPNSWGVPQFEYLLKVLEWGERGYIMLEYETRGWYASGGTINEAGPKDVEDHRRVVDYALSRSDWFPNKTRVGSCGISYGAGISLLAAANDSRIVTAAAMSGWGSLYDALRNENTPSLIWADLLDLLAKLVGKAPPYLQQELYDSNHNVNISRLREFTAVRSPNHYLAQTNARKVPLFISNNLEDRLFKPQYALQYYQQVLSPKFLLLNQGIHATAELGGLVDLDKNYVWNKAKLWLDHYLRDIDTGITEEPRIHIQQRGGSTYHSFSTWPASNVASVSYHLGERGDLDVFGSLSTDAPHHVGSNSITYFPVTGLSAGLPVVGELFQVWADVPIVSELPLTLRTSSVVYASDTFKEETLLCGTPNVTIALSANKPSYQVVAYLYSVDIAGVGTLISHGPYTHWGTVGTSDDAQVNAVKFPMRTLCTSIEAGYYVALGFDLFSDLYHPADDSLDLVVKFNQLGGESGATLELPIVQS